MNATGLGGYGYTFNTPVGVQSLTGSNGSVTLTPIDAVPDITNVQVQINSVVEGLAPVEVEKRVTFPIETAVNGASGVRREESHLVVVTTAGEMLFATTSATPRRKRQTASVPEGARPVESIRMPVSVT